MYSIYYIQTKLSFIISLQHTNIIHILYFTQWLRYFLKDSKHKMGLNVFYAEIYIYIA